MKLRELPEPLYGFYGTPMHSAEQVRAIQLQAARDALEWAAKVAERWESAAAAADAIREMKVEQP